MLIVLLVVCVAVAAFLIAQSYHERQRNRISRRSRRSMEREAHGQGMGEPLSDADTGK